MSHEQMGHRCAVVGLGTVSNKTIQVNMERDQGHTKWETAVSLLIIAPFCTNLYLTRSVYYIQRGKACSFNVSLQCLHTVYILQWAIKSVRKPKGSESKTTLRYILWVFGVKPRKKGKLWFVGSLKVKPSSL